MTNQNNSWQKFYKSSYSRVAGYAVAAGLVAAIGLNIWIDPISPGTPGGNGNLAGQKTTPEAVLADRADSLVNDSLQLQPGVINTNTSSLQLVSGKQ